MLRLNKPAIIAGAIAALALVPATSGATPSADELNPPPPSDYTCKPVGGGTICTVIRHESKVAELQPELSCGSGADAFNIYDNGDVEQRLTRRYNADARLGRGTGSLMGSSASASVVAEPSVMRINCSRNRDALLSTNRRNAADVIAVRAAGSMACRHWRARVAVSGASRSFAARRSCGTDARP